MKTLAVLGCSYSTGEETCDYEIYENYYDTMASTNRNEFAGKHNEFMMDRKFNIMPKWYEDNKRMVDIERKDPIFPDRPDRTAHQQGLWNDGKGFLSLESYWNHYNDKFSYGNVLHTNLPGYNVVNMARRGTGLNYQHFIYNMHRQIMPVNSEGKWLTDGHEYIPELEFKRNWLMKAYYPALHEAPEDALDNSWNRFVEINWHGAEQPEDFRYDTMIDNADVLVWQLTGEPRYTITIRGNSDLGLGASLQNLIGWFDYNKGPNTEFLKEYYKYHHNPATDIASSVGWMESIIKLREAKELKTIVLNPTSQYISRFGVKPIDTKYTKYLGFEVSPQPDASYDLVNVGLRKINGIPENKARWGHLSKKGHKYIAELISETLEEME